MKLDDAFVNKVYTVVVTVEKTRFAETGVFPELRVTTETQ